MKFAILGGDERMLRLVSLLRRDGHTVSPFAMERRLDCTPRPDTAGADTIILPLPCAANGLLFAPFSGEKHPLSTLFDEVSPGTAVLAGKAAPELQSLCRERGLPLHDYFLREDFTLRNAVLTAEGALGLLMSSSPRAIAGSRVLIYGFGRIGRALAQRLLGCGAHVLVAARDPAQRVLAESMGCAALPFSARPEADFVVNTVPHPHLFSAAFGKAVCLELASPPYGFELDELSGRVLLGSALPGKCAPESAAEAIRDTIYNILEESK